MVNVIRLMFLLIVIYNVLDVYQTMLLINHCCMSEMNPILNYFGDKFGLFKSMIIIKSIFLSALGFGLYLKFREYKK